MELKEIMAKVAKGELTQEQATAMIEAQQTAAVKEATKKRLTLKVSPKGAVQLDGLRRFPVTLYRDEWEQVLNFGNEIKAFIAVNKSKLAEKGE
jgi:hypothetical protein